MLLTIDTGETFNPDPRHGFLIVGMDAERKLCVHASFTLLMETDHCQEEFLVRLVENMYKLWMQVTPTTEVKQ